MLLIHLAAVLLASPVSPSRDEIERDLSAIKSANVDVIPLNLARCAAEKIRANTPRYEDKGNRERAAVFLESALHDCGRDDAIARVRSGLRTANPDVNDTDLDRQIAVAFAFPAIGLTMLLNEQFEIEASANAPEPQVEIPQPTP